MCLVAALRERQQQQEGVQSLELQGSCVNTLLLLLLLLLLLVVALPTAASKDGSKQHDSSCRICRVLLQLLGPAGCITPQ
jgi:hypothetical protein